MCIKLLVSEFIREKFDINKKIRNVLSCRGWAMRTKKGYTHCF